MQSRIITMENGSVTSDGKHMQYSLPSLDEQLIPDEVESKTVEEKP
jgi:hypothetical protein